MWRRQSPTQRNLKRQPRLLWKFIIKCSIALFHPSYPRGIVPPEIFFPNRGNGRGKSTTSALTGNFCPFLIVHLGDKPYIILLIHGTRSSLIKKNSSSGPSRIIGASRGLGECSGCADLRKKENAHRFLGTPTPRFHTSDVAERNHTVSLFTCWCICNKQNEHLFGLSTSRCLVRKPRIGQRVRHGAKSSW